jgi:hypothetical protein
VPKRLRTILRLDRCVRSRPGEEERPQRAEETANCPRPQEERENKIDAAGKRDQAREGQSEADQPHERSANNLHQNCKPPRASAHDQILTQWPADGVERWLTVPTSTKG